MPKPGSEGKSGAFHKGAGSPERVMASGFPQDTIAAVHDLEQEGVTLLEWKPRLIAVLLVLIAVAIAAGFIELDTVVNNWEW